jgi:hypothetical protein
MMTWKKSAVRARPQLMRAAAATLLVLYLVIGVLAAVPDLHSALHKDANAPGHHCAITLILQGQIELPAGEISVCRISECIDCATPFVLSFEVASVEFLPFGRGPPLFFA